MRLAVVVPLALGLLFGGLSCLLFVQQWLVGPRPALELWQFIGAFAFFAIRLYRASPQPYALPRGKSELALGAVNVLAFAGALYALAAHALQNPQGGWDAWWIWNV